MNQDIQQFTNELFGNLRILVKDNEILFIATDVAKALGYRDSYNLTRLLDDDEKGTHIVSTLGGSQSLSVINESGLYNAIFNSRLSNAKLFKKWVTSEVLPTMRKIGFEKSDRILKEELMREQQRALMLEKRVEDLTWENNCKYTRLFSTTAWVTYTDSLTPAQKEAALLFDPGEYIDYKKLVDDMNLIDSKQNYYPKFEAYKEPAKDTMDFIANAIGNGNIKFINI